MKNQKHNHSTKLNSNGKRKQPLKQIKTTKHFIIKPKSTKFHSQTRKLFSLQHQTLNVLKKADKFKLKDKKSTKQVDILMNKSLFDNTKNNLVDKTLEQSNLETSRNNLKLNNSFQIEKMIDMEETESCRKNCVKANENSNVKVGTHKKKRKRKDEKKLLEEISSHNNIKNDMLTDLLEPSPTVTEVNVNENVDTFLSNSCNDVVMGSDNFFNSSGVDFYQFSKSHVLLSLMHPCSLYLIGILEIEVLVGAVDVLGYTISRLSGKQTLYSPKGVGHLCITTKEKGELDDISLQHLLRKGISEDKINSVTTKFKNSFVMLFLNKDMSNISSIIWPKFVEKYSEKVLLPSIPSPDYVIENTLQCTFQLYSQFTKLYHEMPEWNDICSFVKEDSKTFICGGNGVGKSTLLRYLINKSLSSWDKVLVIDFDPGQSEFMLPGCISAFLVNSPLLGPNFTHLLNPLRSVFYGYIDVNQNIKYYFICIENIMNYCNSQEDLKNIPWFINNIGFNKGFGVLITSSVIRKVSPSLVIQIESQHKSRNYPSLLTPEFVEENILNLSRSDSDPKILDYKILAVPSAVENSKFLKKNKKKQAETWGLAAPSLRNIMILSYFGQMLNSKLKDIFHIEPYKIRISDIHVGILHENLTKEAVLDIINGDLVALCHKSSEYDRSNLCLGFGIVRAVNKESEELFLLTPLNENKLRNVNSIVKGFISLPNKIYLDPPVSITGLVPYVSVSNNVLCSTVKKTFKNLLDTN